MRAALALALGMLLLPGCLGYGTVRAALTEETIVFGAGAPPEISAPSGAIATCPPGVFDEDARVIHLRPREGRPLFVELSRKGDEVIALVSSGNGPAALPPVVMEQRASGATGTVWSWSPEPPLMLSWDDEGAHVMGERLVVDQPWERTLTHNATWEDATFEVTHTFRATYLGRVPYDETHVCP